MQTGLFSSLQDWLTHLYFEMIVPSRAGCLAVFLTLLGSLAILSDHTPDYNSRLRNVLIVLEVVFPMLGAVVTANLILTEREQQTLEFLAVRHSLTAIWVVRLTIMLVVMHSLLFAELLLLNWLYVELSITEMLITAGAPLLSLAGAASLLGVLSREVNVGYIGAALWWGLCLLSPRTAESVFGPYFFLFSRLFGFETEWLLNKAALFSLGVFLLFVNGLLLWKGERLVT